MKRLFLSLFLLFAAFSIDSKAQASGSNTVFISISPDDYTFASAVTDKWFNNTQLYNYLESSQKRQVMVARVNSYIYRTAYYWTNWGYDMSIGFQDFETVTFQYYPRFGAVLGRTSNEDIVVLLPHVTLATTIGTGILLD